MEAQEQPWDSTWSDHPTEEEENATTHRYSVGKIEFVTRYTEEWCKFVAPLVAGWYSLTQPEFWKACEKITFYDHDTESLSVAMNTLNIVPVPPC